MNNNKFEDFKKYCLGKRGKGASIFGKSEAFQSENGTKDHLKKDEANETLNEAGNNGELLEVLKNLMVGSVNKTPQEGAKENSQEGAKENSQEESFPMTKLQLVTLLKTVNVKRTPSDMSLTF